MSRLSDSITRVSLGNVNIRVAVEADAEAIARIYNHYIDAGEATLETVHWPLDLVIKRVKSVRPDGWFVADSEVGIIGWSAARRFSDRDGYRLCCETSVYLDPVAFGRNVGNKLQQSLDDHCRQCGLHHAVARIIADNDRSMSFHYRHGYELVGIQKEIGHMNGRWVDVAILQKLYPPSETHEE